MYIFPVFTDKLYQKALVKWREVYDDRQKSLTMQMEQVILPFFRDLVTQISNMASGDKQSFGKLGEMFDAFIEWQHDIHRFIGLFSRYFNRRYMYGLKHILYLTQGQVSMLGGSESGSFF